MSTQHVDNPMLFLQKKRGKKLNRICAYGLHKLKDKDLLNKKAHIGRNSQ